MKIKAPYTKPIQQTKLQTNRQAHGFTMIEMSIALGILILLLTLGAVMARNVITNTRLQKAQNDLELIHASVELLRIDTSQWPGHQEPKTVCSDLPGGCPANNEICDDGCAYTITSGFAGLTQDDATTPYDGWKGPYMETIPLDPWGNQYFIDTDYDIGGGEDRAVIGSYGPNGLGNNQYDADDIILMIGF